MFLLCLLWHVCELPSRDFKAAWLWGSSFLLETICAFMNARGGLWAAEGWIKEFCPCPERQTGRLEKEGGREWRQNYSLSPVNTSDLYRNKATATSFSLCSENIGLLSVHRLHAKLCPESWPLLGVLMCLASPETQVLDIVLWSSEELSRSPSLHVPDSGLYHSSLYVFLSTHSCALNSLLMRSYTLWKLRSCLFCSSLPPVLKPVSSTERASGECLLNEYVINNSHEATTWSIY